MPFSEAGLVVKDLYVAGFPLSACYLLDGKRPVLFESGYTCAGRLYAEAIREVLARGSPRSSFSPTCTTIIAVRQDTLNGPSLP